MRAMSPHDKIGYRGAERSSPGPLTQRRFRAASRHPGKFSLLCLLFFLLAGTFGSSGNSFYSPKKGVGFWNSDESFNHLSRSVDDLRCAWYYNWTTVPDRASPAMRAEFIPMVWNGHDVTPENLARLQAQGFRTLLAFNEPDMHEQSNMTVEEAIALWPQLMKTGMRLGSPSPAVVHQDKGWLADFMAEAQRRNYRVDFICLHWYGDITAPDAVAQLKAFLEKQWELYHRPIWLTEFSGSTGDWIKHVNPPVTQESNIAFIREVIPMLESLPFVERYAWFELKWEVEPWKDVALILASDGRMTEVGKAYQVRGSGR